MTASPARRHPPASRVRLAAVAGTSLLLAACAAGPTWPALYKFDPGPHAVHVATVSLHDPAGDRDIAIRVASPADPGNYPVVVFSHGARCYPEEYARVTDHWVSHGYVVVAPNHLDSPNNPVPLRPDQLAGLIDSRIRDLSFVVDRLPEIATLAGVAGTADSSRLAVGGHSFGGMLAMIKVGLPLRNPAGGTAVDRSDPRFRAAVVMSGVGPMPQMADNAFAGLQRPLMATGGTKDEGNVGSGQIFPWEWRLSAYSLGPAGDKYEVVLEDGDHYLGGLICRPDRGGPKDAEGVAIDRAMTTAFLDAYLMQDPQALRFLRTADVAALTRGRARYEHK